MGRTIKRFELLSVGLVSNPTDPNCRMEASGIITEEDGVMEKTQALEDPRTQIGIAERKVAVILEHVNALPAIVDDATRAMVVDARSTANKLKGALEKNRKDLVEPQRRIVNFINEHYKPMKEQLEGAIEKVDVELKRDRLEQERIALEAREAAEELARVAQKKIDDEAAAAAKQVEEDARKQALKAGFDEHDAEALGIMEGQDTAGEVQKAAPPPPPMLAPAPAKTVSTVSEDGQVASATFKKVWDFEVEDMRKVLGMYLEVRTTAVREWMRLYIKNNGSVPEHPPEMPGIRFFQRTDIAQGR